MKFFLVFLSIEYAIYGNKLALTYIFHYAIIKITYYFGGNYGKV